MFRKIVVTLLLLSSLEVIADEVIPLEFYNQVKSQKKLYQDKNRLKIISKDTEGTRSDIVEGRYWKYEYKLEGVTRKAFIKDIEASIKNREGTILFKGSDYIFFKLYNKKNLYKGMIVQYKNKYIVEMVREGAIVQDKPKGNIVLKNLQFESNKAIIKDGAKGEIDRIVQFLMDNPSYNVEIQGHTDSSGDSSKNLKLSQSRAETVATEVIKAGIDFKRLTTRGYGDKNPIADNGTKIGRRANRRVEIKVL